MSRMINLIVLVLFSYYTQAFSQTSFTGTFMNNSATISLQFKLVGEEYHGLLQTYGASFAMKGKTESELLKGTIYSLAGPVEFTAGFKNNLLEFNALGYADHFYKFSTDHSLHGLDLTVYMYDASQYNNNPYSQSDPEQAPRDYNYSYSQHHRGYSTENYTTAPPGGSTANSPYPELADPELKNLIAGSQVVYYTRTSYVNDNVASSITYVNFCPDGLFWVNYDGSFSVEGNYGGNAQGATYGQNSGTWTLVTANGQPSIYMAYYNGNTSVNPVNKNLIYQGRWKIGNTQYAIQRNKVSCR